MYFLPNAVTTSSTKPDPVGWKAGYTQRAINTEINSSLSFTQQEKEESRGDKSGSRR